MAKVKPTYLEYIKKARISAGLNNLIPGISFLKDGLDYSFGGFRRIELVFVGIG